MHQAGGPVESGRLPIRRGNQRAGGNATGADAGAGLREQVPAMEALSDGMAELLKQHCLDLLDLGALKPSRVEVDTFSTTSGCMARVSGHEPVHGAGWKNLEADPQASAADGGLDCGGGLAALRPEGLQQQGVVGATITTGGPVRQTRLHQLQCLLQARAGSEVGSSEQELGHRSEWEVAVGVDRLEEGVRPSSEQFRSGKSRKSQACH